MIEFEFDLVGGGYDGVPGLSWRDDGKHPCPESIFVGLCGKANDCGMNVCRAGKSHVAFWTPEEQGRPLAAQHYEKQDEFIERDDDGEPAGRAVYAIGGLLDPRNFGASARVPVPDTVPEWLGAPLVPAGRHDTGWPR